MSVTHLLRKMKCFKVIQFFVWLHGDKSREKGSRHTDITGL